MHPGQPWLLQVTLITLASWMTCFQNKACSTASAAVLQNSTISSLKQTEKRKFVIHSANLRLNASGHVSEQGRSDDSSKGHLAAAGAAKDAVDEGGLRNLPGRLGMDARQDGLVHGVQQGDQVLMRVLLPPQPEAAGQAEQASQTGAAAWLLLGPWGAADSVL